MVKPNTTTAATDIVKRFIAQSFPTESIFLTGRAHRTAFYCAKRYANGFVTPGPNRMLNGAYLAGNRDFTPHTLGAEQTRNSETQQKIAAKANRL